MLTWRGEKSDDGKAGEEFMVIEAHRILELGRGLGRWFSSGRPRGLGSIRLARLRIELDHLFVCTAPGAPEAEELVRFGLREGPPNRHPGQGTANRRFAFANTMIELLWVSDA